MDSGDCNSNEPKMGEESIFHVKITGMIVVVINQPHFSNKALSIFNPSQSMYLEPIHGDGAGAWGRCG